MASLPAAAQDSEAPHGAGENWLPCESWVMFHWLPYDEHRLYRELGVGRDVVLRWLRRDHHRTLADLAERRGKNPAAIAARLTRGRPARMRERAMRTITQGHLAQHLLFHRFHHPGLAASARRIFGVSPLAYQRARARGRAPGDIARAHGRRPRQLRARALRVLTRYARLGVRRGEVSHTQAARFLAMQRRGLDDWLYTKLQKKVRRGRRRARPRNRAELMCMLFTGRRTDRPAGVHLESRGG